MRIIINEEQKKKLFIPRNIDSRLDQLNNEIKKFLISIKDSIVWEYFGMFYVSYNFESDYLDVSFYDLKNQYYDEYRFKQYIIKEYGEERGKEIIRDVMKETDKIWDYMETLVKMHGNGDYDIIYVSSYIENMGNGVLKYEEHKDVRVSEKVREVKI